MRFVLALFSVACLAQEAPVFKRTPASVVSLAEASPPAPELPEVKYVFGRGASTIVCAPLRMCVIELQPGERFSGEPNIGDPRWHIAPASYGSGEDVTAVVVLKPEADAMNTDLLLTTDRRAYYLRLVPDKEKYYARVRFSYPDDPPPSFQKALAAIDSAQIVPVIAKQANKNYGYQVSGGNAHVRPLKVYDNGEKTYLEMPAEMKNRERPALVVIGDDGKPVMSNYRVLDSGAYEVDRLFDHAQLRIGGSKKPTVVDIRRDPKG